MSDVLIISQPEAITQQVQVNQLLEVKAISELLMVKATELLQEASTHSTLVEYKDNMVLLQTSEQGPKGAQGNQGTPGPQGIQGPSGVMDISSNLIAFYILAT